MLEEEVKGVNEIAYLTGLLRIGRRGVDIGGKKGFESSHKSGSIDRGILTAIRPTQALRKGE